MKTAEEILTDYIHNWFENNPMTRFDDIPNTMFIEAMESYASQFKPKPVDRAEIRGKLISIINSTEYVYQREGEETIFCDVAKLADALLPYFGAPVIDREKAIEAIRSAYEQVNDSEQLNDLTCKSILTALLSANIFK